MEQHSPKEQRSIARLGAEQLDQLAAALGWLEPVTVPELRDLDGQLLVSDGRPAPEYDRLMRSFSEQRAVILVQRVDSQGRERNTTIRLSPHGMLWQEPQDDGSVLLRGAAGGTLYPVLIDWMGLGPRPAPAHGVVPAEVPKDLMVRAVDFSQGPDGPAAARHQAAAAVRGQSPQIADDLEAGQADVVVLAAEWDDGAGGAQARLMGVDTPAGMLVHSAERRFLGEKHLLEPAPAWVVWHMTVASLPGGEDIARWGQHA
ncbi:hypothetical protein [Nesterenkonia sp. F]|uniref:hypothetical protein n=1 Tax=Nesterenkonia sp. F TaxID=795955 RepID=UPI000255CF9C|nr:hypothetical protein [Nesterenkonia sp. F]